MIGPVHVHILAPIVYFPRVYSQPTERCKHPLCPLGGNSSLHHLPGVDHYHVFTSGFLSQPTVSRATSRLVCGAAAALSMPAGS